MSDISVPIRSQVPLFRHRSFRLFFTTRATANTANQMQAVAVGWLVYDLTGSALDLGLIGLVQFVPPLCLTLLAGQVVDQYSRGVILRVCYLVELAVSLGLLLLARIPVNGSYAADLWVMDVKANNFVKLGDEDYKGNYLWPMYGHNGEIYYVADQLPNEKNIKPGGPEVMQSVKTKSTARDGRPIPRVNERDDCRAAFWASTTTVAYEHTTTSMISRVNGWLPGIFALKVGTNEPVAFCASSPLLCALKKSGMMALISTWL